ncbi:MAG: hypothetical protein ABI162_02160 [Luteolibacter sp.]
MKAALLFFLAGLGTLHAQIREVPESRSRDGKWAVFYSKVGGDDCAFCAREISGKKSFPLGRTAVYDEQTDLQRMYEIAGIALDRWFSDGGRGAEECRVSWNANGTMLAVEAGAHKFGSFSVYRKSSEGMSEVPFPQNYEERLIDFAKATSQKIHEMGVNRFGDHKGVLTDGAEVNFLENGYIAVSAYGAECNRAFQELPEEIQFTTVQRNLFFLFHAAAKGPAKFVGFCH